VISYATLNEIKAASPGSWGASTDYDDILVRMALRASRLIDRLAKRGKVAFVETLATRYYDGDGARDLWIPPLLALTSLHISSNDGSSYSQLVASDYLLLGGPDAPEYDATPYRIVRLAQNGNYSRWYSGQQSAKVIGLWGWHDDYSNAWEDSQDTVQNDPLAANGTTVTVGDADGADIWGETDRFQVGMLIQMGTEQSLITARNTSTNVLTITRAQNGTTAAEHANGTAINVWRPALLVKMATIAQTVRWFKRAEQAWQDSSASLSLGQLLYTQELDPEVVAMIHKTGIRRVSL
jgi:hypothetical protein